MKTKDFFYKLPKELIAHSPLPERDNSKLMVLDRNKRTINHNIFNELPLILSSEYFLVFNQTKVFPAKLKAKINDKPCEILLLNELNRNLWNCMVKPGKKFRIGERITIKGKIEDINNDIEATVEQINEDGTRILGFDIKDNFSEWIDFNGYPPLPPYIKNDTANLQQYQTTYAKKNGSIAAPTAGLHFTDNTFNQLKKRNIDHTFVTLHVGRGTFLPVKSENLIDHKMHTENYEIDINAEKKLNSALKSNKKILAVGTTTVRTLESNFRDGKFTAEKNHTDIFIYPGYSFKAVHAMITNFHLPESTLLMLISAFAGKDFIFSAYNEAIKRKYRFYSFGDAMLIH